MGIIREMKFLILALFFLSQTAFAQRSLTPQIFQSKVRPTLNAIVNDFYQMVTHFPDFPKELVGVIAQMEKVTQEKENLLMACPRHLDKNCLTIIDSLREKLSVLQGKTLELTSNIKASASPYINTLGGLRVISNFQIDLQALKGNLDNSSFLIRAQIKEKKETFLIIKKMDELKTVLSLSVSEFIPYLYKDTFRDFLFNFIHPIEQHVAKESNYKFLNHNISALNFALNHLNMKLTKRNKKTPEGMAPYLSLMHNRWNNLLRYYF